MKRIRKKILRKLQKAQCSIKNLIVKIRNKQIRYIKKKCRRFQYLRRFLRLVTFFTFLLLGASGLCNVDQQNNWTSMIPISFAAVDADVTNRGTAPCNKGLMVFIQPCESDTDNSGEQKQPESSHTIDIKRKRNCNSQKEIFCHMSGFSYIKMDLIGFIVQFVVTFFLV